MFGILIYRSYFFQWLNGYIQHYYNLNILNNYKTTTVLKLLLFFFNLNFLCYLIKYYILILYVSYESFDDMFY